MECNKEEAIRAMEIAKKRLLNRDYAGAKEMALKSKKLFPLDNISQLLAVCEVHCSAQLMSNGLYDWYKIIQVRPVSDKILIGKQYRVLVRLLHPDKNKFPGAEAAFTLVVEANKTLSNWAKRKVYDNKRKHLTWSAGLQQCTGTNSAHNSSSDINRDNNWRPQQKLQRQPHQGLNFWTACPFCWTQHQYNCNMLYKNVRCKNCSRIFMVNALPHLNPGHVCAATNQPQQCVGQQQPQRSGLCRSTCGQGVAGTSRDITGGTRKLESNPNPPRTSNASSANTIRGQKRGETACMDTSQNPKSCSKLNSCLDVSQKGGDGEETDAGAHSAGTSAPLRRLPHNNSDVKYNGTEAGFSIPAKKARVEVKGELDGNGCANATNTNSNVSTRIEEEVKEQGREREKTKEQVEPSGLPEEKDTNLSHSVPAYQLNGTKRNSLPEGSLELDMLAVPSENMSGAKNPPQHFTGQKQPQRSGSYRFACDLGIVTIRDITGGVMNPDSNPCHSSMSNVSSPNTIMGQTGEMVSVHASQNPSPCSKHNLSLDANQRRDDRESTDAGAHSGATRTHLQRLPHHKPDVKYSGTEAGFSSPAKKLTVEIKEVQDGSGDANTTGTNTNASCSVEKEVEEQGREREKEQVEPSGLPEENNTAFKPSGSAKDKAPTNGDTCRVKNSDEHTSTMTFESSQPTADTEYLYECPSAEFHNFNMCRRCNNFQQGHIWALYSDLDTFPKYYGLISKVEDEPFKVHISWLEACPKFEVERAWLDANLPISCGKFRVVTQGMIYDKPDYFSHMVSVRHHGRDNNYEILPEVGEVWAIYKNWSAGWTPHDFKTCKFDIVEIIEHREESTVVWPLRQVPEYTSVFMPEQVDGTGSGTFTVPASAYILFSHKIPAIRLTEECGGKLKGFWELDPASVPYALFYHDK